MCPVGPINNEPNINDPFEDENTSKVNPNPSKKIQHPQKMPILPKQNEPTLEGKHIEAKHKSVESKESGRRVESPDSVIPTSILRETIAHLKDPSDKFALEEPEHYVSCLLKDLRSELAQSINYHSTIKPNITFILYPQGGMGDVMFVYKLASELLHRNCEVNIAVMKGREMSIETIVSRLKSLPETTHMNILTPQTIDQNYETGCVIIGPTDPKKNIILRNFPNFAKTPTEYVGEYCFQRSLTMDIPNNTYTLKKAAGIRPHELGIYAEEKLKPPLSKTQRIHLLNKLRSAPNIDTIFNGKETEAYLETNKLYFGYGHQSEAMSKFVSTVAACNKEDSKDLDVVLPWRIKERDRNKNEFWQNCRIDKKELRKTGVTDVEIIIDGVIHSTEKLIDKEPSKTLRIRNIFPIPNNEFKELMHASEDLIFITGDQSWNEAIFMSDKIPIYETMSWKFEFRRSQIKMAESTPLMHDFLENTIRFNIDSIASSYKNLKKEKSLSHSEGRVSEIESYHRKYLEIENFPDSLLNQLNPLLNANEDPAFYEALTLEEKQIKDQFTIPIVLHEAMSKLTGELFAQANSSPEHRFFDNTGGLKKSLMEWWNKHRLTPPIDDDIRDKMDKVVEALNRVLNKDLSLTRQEILKIAIPAIRSREKCIEYCRKILTDIQSPIQ